LEIKIPRRGNQFPSWKSKSPVEEINFQVGNPNPPWRKSISKLEIKIPRGGNQFPSWKLKSPVEETNFQVGN